MSKVRTFGQVVDFHIGGGWGQAEPTDVESAPAYVIRGTDIPSARYGDVAKVPVRFHKPAALDMRKLLPGDIVFESSGGSPGQPVGRALRVTHALLAQFDEPVMCASFCKLVRPDPAEVEGAYLYYSLLNSYEDGTLSEYQVQSTGITNFQWKPFLEKHLLDLPSAGTQRSAAALLASIDDLIENNRRRIEVLEEMAQAIYREWFVNFRYPGHEDATFVDSPLGPIPDGWEVGNVGEVIELNYGKALKKEDRLGGDVAVIGSSGIVGWHDSALVDGPSIVVGRKGNVGNVIWVSTSSWPIDTTYFVRTKLPLRYVAEQLKRAEFINSHAAVPGLSREQAYSVGFLHPTADAMNRFQSVADLLGEQTDALRRSADRLESVRDLLLPRLVTGEIDVSAIDLDAVVGAVP